MAGAAYGRQPRRIVREDIVSKTATFSYEELVALREALEDYMHLLRQEVRGHGAWADRVWGLMEKTSRLAAAVNPYIVSEI